MADKDFRIDLILGAKFAEGFRAIDEAKRRLEGAERSAGKFNRTGATLGTVLRTAGYAGIAAASAATAVMGLYIQKTIEAEKVQAQLAARIKDTGGVAGRTLDDLNKQSKALSHVTVFDDEAIGQAQAMLLTFTQIRGVNFDNTVEATLNLATAMGTDATDAAKTLGKALSDPAKGMDQLKRAGVTFTDAQRAVIQKMVETGHIAEAQGMLLDALKSKMGSAATAARNTLGGALQALKNAFDDVLEGDTGDAGIKGTRNAIESLIGVLNDPSTRAGVQAFIGDLVQIANFAIQSAAAVGGLTQAIRDALAEDSKKTYEGLLTKRANLVGDLADATAGGENPLSPRRLRLVAGGRSGEAYSGITGMQAKIAEIDRRLQQLGLSNPSGGKNPFAPGGPLAFKLPTGSSFSLVNPVPFDPNAGLNPSPEGEGVIKPPKTGGGGSKSDPDAAAKNYLADLQKQVALLGLVKQGEDDASEAAKAHYAVTEGEYKNASPALKAQIEAAAQALDQKNADIEAEKKRQEQIEQTKEAYGDLLQELRTPAEVAVDDAIAQVKLLSDALVQGAATKADYDKAMSRVVGNLIGDQPDFQGLAPEVGGAYGELSKLDQAAADEQKWYDDSLARLAQYRALKEADQQAADAQEEALEEAHQNRMKQIEGAKHQASLQLVSGFLGQIAQLQNSQNEKAARVGKAAAIAQAIINTYEAATAAYKAMAGIPVVGPYLGAAAAGMAVAAGMANVAAIRAQPTGGGYAEGGYTGAGGKYQPAGIVHAGEGVLNQGEIAALGGPSGFYALREWIDEGHARAMLQGYADGGLAGVSMPALTPPDWASYPQGGKGFGASVNNALRVYLSLNEDDLAQRIANHPANEARIVAVTSENGMAIKTKWGSS